MSILQGVAVALADFLMGDLGSQPYRGVIFLLGALGHRNGVPSPGELDDPSIHAELIRIRQATYERTKKFAQVVNQFQRQKHKSSYDPLEIVEFNSFDELIAQRPKSGQWDNVLLITHGPGEAGSRLIGSIWLGEKEYFVAGGGMNDILDKINSQSARVDAFRKGFRLDADLTIIGCAIGAESDSVPLYTRELFGIEGAVLFTKRDMYVQANGKLQVLVDDDPIILRDLEDKDWGLIRSKAEVQSAEEFINLWYGGAPN